MVELFAAMSMGCVLLGGDFDAHHQFLSSQWTNTARTHLHEALAEANGVCLLNDPAFPTNIQNGRLDLTFASARLSLVTNWSLHLTLLSDHFGILIDIRLETPPQQQYSLRYNLRQAKWRCFHDLSERAITST